MLQAESPEGVANADAIMSVPGVDAVFIGPNDLPAQMHKTPRMESDDPQFVEALDHIQKTAARYGIAAGIHTASHETCNRRMAQGFRFMAIASDARFMVAGSAGGAVANDRDPRPRRRKRQGSPAVLGVGPLGVRGVGC